MGVCKPDHGGSCLPVIFEEQETAPKGASMTQMLSRVSDLENGWPEDGPWLGLVRLVPGHWNIGSVRSYLGNGASSPDATSTSIKSKHPQTNRDCRLQWRGRKDDGGCCRNSPVGLCLMQPSATSLMKSRLLRTFHILAQDLRAHFVVPTKSTSPPLCPSAPLPLYIVLPLPRDLSWPSRCFFLNVIVGLTVLAPGPADRAKSSGRDSSSWGQPMLWGFEKERFRFW